MQRTRSRAAGRLEALQLVNMNNIETYVDDKVANLTFVVNSLDGKCSKCPSQEYTQPQPVQHLIYKDCSDYYVVGKRSSETYRVTPDPTHSSFEVYCDMETMGGGWTVLQARLDGSTNFTRGWKDYKVGFGNLDREFWLGNDKIHLLTKSKEMILRIDLEDFNGVTLYALYDQFYVANEFLKYRLHIGNYNGTAGDALRFSKHYNHDLKFFTTPDRDNDSQQPSSGIPEKSPCPHHYISPLESCPSYTLGPRSTRTPSHHKAKMGRRQCKSAYNIIKNKTTPESSPPPTPKSDYCNADKAEENDLKKSLMKMLEEAFEEKMKNVSKEIGENTNKKLEEINKEIEEKKSKKLEEMNNKIEEKKNKKLEEMNNEIEEKKNKRVEEMNKEIEEKRNKKLQELDKEIEEKINKKLKEMNKEIEEKRTKNWRKSIK
ncbi:hypothetical protein STEG23_031701 [Scotinomys teguina]